MVHKIKVSVAMWFSVLVSMEAQIDHWSTVKFGNLQCDFPTSYSPIAFSGASGIFYDGGNIYLTVTALPDTSKMKGNPDRDYTRDFMLVVQDVSRKLNGRVREFRDTVIANMPAYISKMEVSYKDGRKSNYELLQVVHQDSMRGFSAQYYLDDANALKARERFFKSITLSSATPVRKGPDKLGLWIGAGLCLLVGAWVLLKTSLLKRT